MVDLPEHPFTTADLGELGLPRHRLRQLQTEGTVRTLVKGAFVRSDLVDTVELRAEAAALVLPPHSVVCDRSAAWLHGVDCFEQHEDPSSTPIEVVSVGQHDRTRRPELYGGKRLLLAEDICTVNGVRVTTPVRTAADLARLRGRRTALAVLDAFARHCGVSRDEHIPLMRRLTGHRGVVQYRHLAPLADARSESYGESWTRLAILDHGLPAPTPQVWVDLPGHGRARLDLAYEDWKIAVEYDGVEFHSSEAARAADAVRRAALRRAGWLVIVVTKEDFRDDDEGQWLGTLSAAIRERRTSRRRQYSRSEASPDFARRR